MAPSKFSGTLAALRGICPQAAEAMAEAMDDLSEGRAESFSAYES